MFPSRVQLFKQTLNFARGLTLILDNRGTLNIVEGISAEIPRRPDVPEDVMKLAYIELNPFTFTPLDTEIKRVRNQRFTMKDIGQMNVRLNNVEKMTTLNLLEKDAEGFEVLDANGLNRFKSGFLVDNFQGHRIGDVAHKDYKVSINFKKGILRPTHISKSVDLEESVSSDATRTSLGYQKTGDLLTLPYTEEVLTEQPFASTVERVAPFVTATWKGTVSLDPTQDNWIETEIAPDLIINKEGDYDAVLTSVGNNLGVVWNSWQTTWQGTVLRDDGLPDPVDFVGDGWDNDFSDVRLKEDIQLVGKSPSGINIYRFKYKHTDGLQLDTDGIYQGVMAQEVPQARRMTDTGFYKVDYSKLDVAFRRLT